MDLVVLPSGKGKPILNLPQIPASLARKVTKLWSSHHEPLCTAQVWTTKRRRCLGRSSSGGRGETNSSQPKGSPERAQGTFEGEIFLECPLDFREASTGGSTFPFERCLQSRKRHRSLFTPRAIASPSTLKGILI